MPLKNIIITWYNPYKNEGRWNAMEFNGIGIEISDFKALRIRNIFDYERLKCKHIWIYVNAIKNCNDGKECRMKVL